MGVSCNFSLKPIDISFRATLIFFLPLCQLHFGSPQSTRCCGCRVVPRLGSGFTPQGLQNSFFREQTWELWLAGTSWDWDDDVGNANWREREREHKKNIYTHMITAHTHTRTHTHTYTYVTLHYITIHYIRLDYITYTHNIYTYIHKPVKFNENCTPKKTPKQDTAHDQYQNMQGNGKTLDIHWKLYQIW